MAYIREGFYICDICGFEMAWNTHDDVHGIIWNCEVCCPDCWEKARVDAE